MVSKMRRGVNPSPGGAAHPEALEGSSEGWPRNVNTSRLPDATPLSSIIQGPSPPFRGSARNLTRISPKTSPTPSARTSLPLFLRKQADGVEDAPRRESIPAPPPHLGSSDILLGYPVQYIQKPLLRSQKGVPMVQLGKLVESVTIVVPPDTGAPS